MSRRPTITAAIIAMNEARNLAELLPELDWVDEIVVVDGGSADATAAVARRHGCRLVDAAVRHLRPTAEPRPRPGHGRVGAVDRRRRASHAAIGGRDPPARSTRSLRGVSRADPQLDLRPHVSRVGHAGRLPRAAVSPRGRPMGR